MARVLRQIGETTITGKNQVSLPAQGMRALGWARGDQLIVQIVGDDMLLLMRRPHDWVAAFAGQMGDVFGDHADTMAYLDGERASWEPEERGAGC